MRRLIPPGGYLLLVVAVTLPAFADKAGTFYTRAEMPRRARTTSKPTILQAGLRPEAEGLTLRAAYERMSFLAGASHVHRGQLLREAASWMRPGGISEGGGIDPSSLIAQQEIRRTRR